MKAGVYYEEIQAICNEMSKDMKYKSRGTLKTSKNLIRKFKKNIYD